ncbi:hypothetical protein QBC35DRAFT_395168 [Podospora australis]|uniref:Uncharacterized protein n=1 Tax=Podospora australis TaxID=1536484 RepID=A0AAN6WJ88_9PEZI|nr:hypothetical protein QBC35DRAFT_395168 [Podospora australis]
MTPTKPLTFLITGTSSGLGLSLARLVLQSGHNLIATSRNPSKNPNLVAEIESFSSPARGRWLPLDVDHPTAGPDLIDSLENAGTHIDVLVNNAGFSIHSPAETLTDGELREMMETLYFGPTRLIRAVLPYMRARNNGVVVNISSGAGLEGRETMGGYAAAKAALDGFTKVLGTEIAPFGIRVLTVQLGTFQTNMGNAARIGATPLPEDYQGDHEVTQFFNGFFDGKFQPDGDGDKAMKALYEVVVGEGVGKGKEAERMLPLGREIPARIKLVTDGYQRALDAFGDICNNVYQDGR